MAITETVKRLCATTSLPTTEGTLGYTTLQAKSGDYTIIKSICICNGGTSDAMINIKLGNYYIVKNKVIIAGDSITVPYLDIVSAAASGAGAGGETIYGYATIANVSCLISGKEVSV